MNETPEPEAKMSITERIVSTIRARIASGDLAAGACLPSVRGLSKEMGVSPMTVVKVYDRLEGEGLVVREHGRGTFVKGERPETQDESKDDLEGMPNMDWQLSILDYLPATRFSNFNSGPPSPDHINLALGILREEFLPLEALRKATKQVAAIRPDAFLTYAPARGDTASLEVLADYIQVPVDETIAVTGTQQAIHLAASTFVGPGDLVVMEGPSYVAAIDVFRTRGARVIQIPVDEKGMQVDVLESLCASQRPKLVYTIPNFQNPTGALLTASRRKRLLDLAEAHQFLILEDDIWSEIYFDEPPPATIYSLDRNGYVIYARSMSKVLSPGCRVAVMCAKNHVFNRLMAAKSMADLGSPFLPQAVAAEVLRSGALQRNGAVVREEMRARYHLTVQALERYAPEGVSWLPVSGGLSLWLSLPDDVDVHAVVAEAFRQEVSILPGSAWFLNDVPGRYIRLCFSLAERDRLVEGVRRVCKVIQARVRGFVSDCTGLPTV